MGTGTLGKLMFYTFKNNFRKLSKLPVEFTERSVLNYYRDYFVCNVRIHFSFEISISIVSELSVVAGNKLEII